MLAGKGRDLGTGRHRAGQGDLGNRRVGDHLGTDIAKSLDDVEDTVRQAGFGQRFGQLQRAERRHFGGLEDHGVAADKGGGRLPAGDLDRVVPRADSEADAERLALGEGEGAAEIDMFAGQRCRQAAEIFQAVRAGGGICDKGFLQGFAGVERFQDGQFVVLLAQDVGGTAQHPAALGGRGRGPDFLTGQGRGNGGIDDGIVGGLDLGDHFAGGRIKAVERGAALAFQIGSANIVGRLRLGAHGRAPWYLGQPVVVGQFSAGWIPSPGGSTAPGWTPAAVPCREYGPRPFRPP